MNAKFPHAIELVKEVELQLSDVSLPIRTALTAKDYPMLLILLRQAKDEAHMLQLMIGSVIYSIEKMEKN